MPQSAASVGLAPLPVTYHVTVALRIDYPRMRCGELRLKGNRGTFL